MKYKPRGEVVSPCISSLRLTVHMKVLQQMLATVCYMFQLPNNLLAVSKSASSEHQGSHKMSKMSLHHGTFCYVSIIAASSKTMLSNQILLKVVHLFT